jgi:pantoate--beta-alanine ligase
MSDTAVARTVDETRSALAAVRARGTTVGLVPTMGALHTGHISLIRQARVENGYVVVSIFVNPTQFGPKEDLSRYPRPLEKDLSICRQENVDLAFVPDANTMYPPRFQTFVTVKELQRVLCGPSRPGHFRGVATVVLKLFNIVQPNIAYFGQKDGQQARIVQQMVQDLNVPVEIRVCPIVREPDGLALSSRNVYLDSDQRKQATVLYRALNAGCEIIASGERDGALVLRRMKDAIGTAPAAVIDYVAVVDAATLEPIDHLRGEVLLALSVKFDQTRLIDNLKIMVPAR